MAPTRLHLLGAGAPREQTREMPADGLGTDPRERDRLLM